MSTNAGNPFTINARECAYMLGVTAPIISAWTKEENNPIPVAEKARGRTGYKFDPQVVIKWFVKKKQQESMGYSKGEPDDKIIDFHAEKTRLTKAQADEKELKVLEAKGEVVPIQSIADIVEGACQMLSSALSSIPAELQRVAPHLSASDIDVVRKVLARVLNGLADITVEAADLGSNSNS